MVEEKGPESTKNLTEVTPTNLQEPSLLNTKETQDDQRLVRVYYVKSARIRSFSGPFLPAFGRNTERYDMKYLSVFSPNARKYGPENSEYGHFSRSSG